MEAFQAYLFIAHIEVLFGIDISACYRGKYIVIVLFVFRRDGVVAVFDGGVDFSCCFNVLDLAFGVWVIHNIRVEFHFAAV